MTMMMMIRDYHRVNPYPGAHRQNETQMYIDMMCIMQEAAHHMVEVSPLVSTSVLVNWLPSQTGIYHLPLNTAQNQIAELNTLQITRLRWSLVLATCFCVVECTRYFLKVRLDVVDI